MEVQGVVAVNGNSAQATYQVEWLTSKLVAASRHYDPPFAHGDAEGQEVFFVSITHLTSDPRLPLTRAITAYQKHRIKRLRREKSIVPALEYH